MRQCVYVDRPLTDTCHTHDTPLGRRASLLSSDPVGAWRRRAKALCRRAPLDSGWLRVARCRCGAKAPPLAARPTHTHAATHFHPAHETTLCDTCASVTLVPLCQAWIESGYYDKTVGSMPAHQQCAEDVELVFTNAAAYNPAGERAFSLEKNVLYLHKKEAAKPSKEPFNAQFKEPHKRFRV